MILQIIIFSFNRALQLDTLVNSLISNWENPRYEIDILYNTTNIEFQKGYEILIKKLSGYKNIRFHKENPIPDQWSFQELSNIHNFIRYFKYGNKFKPKSNFRSLCIDIIKGSNSNNVMFMTDDAMFIRKVDITDNTLEWVNEGAKDRQYSLRCGVDMNSFNENKIEQNEHTLDWNFYECASNTNWGYPFSVDAHIYSKEVVLSLFKKYIFCNPNTLEGAINSQVYRKTLLGRGKASDKPYLLSYPINMVQTVANNESLGVSCEMLNKMYLDGYTLNYPIPEIILDFQQYPRKLYFYKNGEIVIKKLA
ncbi:MAG: hypothetical protein IKJ31_04095 [Bacteroidaceae bacterium]|nr:hypothetical protein [Bacteroidaceae bacterium]